MKLSYEVHESHAELWSRDDWRYALLMGGRGNGRSGSASRFAVSHLMSKEYTRGAIMRAVREDIRPSCWRELMDRLTEGSVQDQFKVTDNEMYIERGENSLRAHGFRASSGSLTARLKSLAGYNFIWIEEAEEIGEDEFRTLDDSLRTTKGRIRIVLSLNTPAKNHWIIKKWFNLEPAEVDGFFIPKLKDDARNTLYIPGTWRENEPNLNLHTIEQYKRYQKEKPQYFYQMIEGMSPEVVMGRIYTGWKQVDELPHEARLLGYGLDFGYDPDPAAIIGVYWYNGGYLLDEKLYQKKLLNEHLAMTFDSLPKAPIVADNAEPKSMAELQAKGLNVIPCEKGQDSVVFGIKHVQGLRVSYTKRSKNLEYEYENYAWKRRKDSVEDDDHLGMEDPLCANHAMSAVRYFLTMFGKPSQDSDYWEDVWDNGSKPQQAVNCPRHR